jgi:microcystin-dependent protein
MSFQTASNQKVEKNVLYNNTIVDNVSTQLENLASIDYVNQQIENINLSSQLTTISLLQQQLTLLQNELNVLQQKNTRIIGSIIISSGLTPPLNYLACNGDLIPTSDYPLLFNIIGYAYGNGGGFNFQLPDLKSLYIVGANNTINNLPYSNLMTGNNFLNATNNYLLSGSATNFPNIDNLPSHAHGINDSGHIHRLHTDTQLPGTFGEQYLETSGYSIQSAPATTGITVRPTGTFFQQVDPLSGIQCVNITPPFTAYNFYICYK